MFKTDDKNSNSTSKITKKKGFGLGRSITLFSNEREKENSSKEFETDLRNYDVNEFQLYSVETEKEELLNKVLGIQHGSFSDIDMIPRTINDLIIAEKKKFSYIHKNL